MERKIAHATPFEGVPKITAADVFGASPDKPFLWRIPVLGERPVQITVTGLPDGLTLRDNLVTGCTAARGSHPVEITAENRLGRDVKNVELLLEPDGMLRTPLLGFTTWNAFAQFVTQKDVVDTADLMMSKGICEYGYTYVNVDSGWQGSYGGAYDAIQPNAKFPDMGGLYAYLHALGLKGGIYSTPMLHAWGCPPEQEFIPGCTRGEPDIRFGDINTGIGLEHCEAGNVKQWCDWKVDYLKYDWTPTDTVNADLMKQVLLRAEREIAFCVTVQVSPTFSRYWNKNCCSWRSNNDTFDLWDTITARMETLDVWKGKTSVGHFYDLDMLAIGKMASLHDEAGNCRLTEDEELYAFTQHSFFPSPVQLSMRLDQLTDFEADLICNEEILAVNQDSLCDYPTLAVTCNDLGKQMRIYTRRMKNGDTAVAVFNMTDAALDGEFPLAGESYIRDLWRKRELGVSDRIAYSIAPHCAAVYRVRGM